VVEGVALILLLGMVRIDFIFAVLEGHAGRLNLCETWSS
jgi:hypothetical protein